MTLLTDPDCPHSVRDQINGIVTQEAREIADGVVRHLAGETVCGEPVLAWMWEVDLPNPPGPARTVAYHWSTPPSHLAVTRLVDARALTANQAEREQLEARVKELEIALRSISRETETDGIEDCWATRGARIARAALGITS